MKPHRIGAGAAALAAALFLAASAGAAPPDSTGGAGEPAPVVLWASVDDIIGPVSASYFVDAVHAAESRDAAVLVVALDTPGGLDTSMRQIIKAVLASRVPVCIYVSPSGARAASAGVYISYSAHVVAMAPGTNLGAATPINMGGQMDSTLAHKVVNDATAYIRSLARLRGRNAEWAAKAVTEAVSLPAQEAVAEHVVDFIATDPRDLLRQMDGRTVRVAGDSTHVIRCENAVISQYSMSFRYRILSLLNNPNVAYLLLMLGFYGLFFELSNPGAVFPGVIGGICLILGLFALQSLSLNYAGLLLIIFGVILFFLETQITSHGLLALGGTVSLLAGSLLLINTPEPAMKVSLRVIIPVVGVTAAFFLFAVTMALRAKRRQVVTGHEGLVGLVGTARTDLSPTGSVFVAGEHWDAESLSGPIPRGTRVEVVAVHRLRITVRPSKQGTEDPSPSS